MKCAQQTYAMSEGNRGGTRACCGRNFSAFWCQGRRKLRLDENGWSWGGAGVLRGRCVGVPLHLSTWLVWGPAGALRVLCRYNVPRFSAVDGGGYHDCLYYGRVSWTVDCCAGRRRGCARTALIKHSPIL